MSREQGDTKIDLRSTKNYFGEHKEKNSGSREKRVKFEREPGAGDPPLQGLLNIGVFLGGTIPLIMVFLALYHLNT